MTFKIGNFELTVGRDSLSIAIENQPYTLDIKRPNGNSVRVALFKLRPESKFLPAQVFAIEIEVGDAL